MLHIKYASFLSIALLSSSIFSMEKNTPVVKEKNEQKVAAIQNQNISHLPTELMEYILPFLSANLDIMNCSLRQLRQVDKNFKTLIDDKDIAWRLVKFLSKKFDKSPLYIMQRLQIPSGRELNFWMLYQIKKAMNSFDDFDSYKKYSNFKALHDSQKRYIIPVFQDDPIRFNEDKPNRLVIARILPDQKVDTTFGTQGIQTISLPPFLMANSPVVNGMDHPFTISTDKDGNHYIASSSENERQNPQRKDLIIACMDKNGQMVQSWGKNGIVRIAFNEILNILATLGKPTPHFTPGFTSFGFKPISISFDNGKILLECKTLIGLMEGIKYRINLPLTAQGTIDQNSITADSVQSINKF